MQRYHRDPSRIRKILGENIQFLQGDMACVYGGLLAGCSFFGGYPITPATEIAEGMSRLIPKVGGMYLQMEDEIASIAAIIGASWAGAKSMTATSSPGFSLMMENYGYAAMTETPCVIINVQRGGPSTGLPTLGSQGDMMQARWGTHGDFETIVLCPSTVQECLDLTIESFNLSEQYRSPVCLMMDGEIGYLHARIVLPDEEHLTIINRRQGDPRTIPNEKIPLFPTFGQGYRSFITGLTHTPKGIPATFDQKEHERLITRITQKITDDREKLTMVEKIGLDDADVAFVTYGASARPATYTVNKARKNGVKAGLLRLKLIWPFPIKEIQQLSKSVQTIIVPEMNLGQIVHPIREYSEGNCKVVSAPKIGGETHHPRELMRVLSLEGFQ
ncbi:MAG: 2-oxoacid:acceptor oxidoreductase subunit alpha [Thermoplasmatota archaeon]